MKRSKYDTHICPGGCQPGKAVPLQTTSLRQDRERRAAIPPVRWGRRALRQIIIRAEKLVRGEKP
jgi:hypothetical protein